MGKAILLKDSWMEIIHQFVHLQTDEYETVSKIYKRKLIFPLSINWMWCKISSRYCSMGRVKLPHPALCRIGKNNSIAWLAYRLSGLHNDANERIFLIL